MWYGPSTTKFAALLFPVGPVTLMLLFPTVAVLAILIVITILVSDEAWPDVLNPPGRLTVGDVPNPYPLIVICTLLEPIVRVSGSMLVILIPTSIGAVGLTCSRMQLFPAPTQMKSLSPSPVVDPTTNPFTPLAVIWAIEELVVQKLSISPPMSSWLPVHASLATLLKGFQMSMG